MFGIKVEISKYVDDYQPGVVECVFIDARGKKHFIVEKLPIITTADLDANRSNMV